MRVIHVFCYSILPYWLGKMENVGFKRLLINLKNRWCKIFKRNDKNRKEVSKVSSCHVLQNHRRVSISSSKFLRSFFFQFHNQISFEILNTTSKTSIILKILSSEAVASQKTSEFVIPCLR